MIRHTLKPLQLLQKSCFKSVSNHFGTLCIKGLKPKSWWSFHWTSNLYLLKLVFFKEEKALLVALKCLHNGFNIANIRNNVGGNCAERNLKDVFHKLIKINLFTTTYTFQNIYQMTAISEYLCTPYGLTDSNIQLPSVLKT